MTTNTLPTIPTDYLEATHRDTIGHVWVDSGHIMLTDPCRVVEFDEATGEFPEGEGQIIEPTYCGDGVYPVIAERDDEGRVIRLIIELTPWA
jgi:hypothetical protein